MPCTPLPVCSLTESDEYSMLKLAAWTTSGDGRRRSPPLAGGSLLHSSLTLLSLPRLTSGGIQQAHITLDLNPRADSIHAWPSRQEQPESACSNFIELIKPYNSILSFTTRIGTQKASLWMSPFLRISLASMRSEFNWDYSIRSMTTNGKPVWNRP